MRVASVSLGWAEESRIRDIEVVLSGYQLEGSMARSFTVGVLTCYDLPVQGDAELRGWITCSQCRQDIPYAGLGKTVALFALIVDDPLI